MVLVIIGVLRMVFFIISIIKGIRTKRIENNLIRLGRAVIKAKKTILTNNEEDLRFNANKQADINKDAIKTTMYSIKEGLTEDEILYCKYCGASIDADSKFCKSCGKEQ